MWLTFLTLLNIAPPPPSMPPPPPLRYLTSCALDIFVGTMIPLGLTTVMNPLLPAVTTAWPVRSVANRSRDGMFPGTQHGADAGRRKKGRVATDNQSPRHNSRSHFASFFFRSQIKTFALLLGGGWGNGRAGLVLTRISEADA